MCAGEIPKVGDFIVSRGWTFEIIDADPKRILSVRVEKLVGVDDSNDDTEDNCDDSSIHGFLKNEEAENAEIIGKQALTSGLDEASSIERMVEDNEKKRSAVKEMIAELNQISEQS